MGLTGSDSTEFRRHTHTAQQTESSTNARTGRWEWETEIGSAVL